METLQWERDLVELAVLAGHEDPYPIFRKLQTSQMLHRNREDGAWVIVHHVDCLRILRDHEAFSSNIGDHHQPVWQDDPPRHTALRAAIGQHFSPARVRALGSWIEAEARSAVAELDSDEFDVVAGLSADLPLRVIAELLGLRGIDINFLRVWSSAQIKPSGRSEIAGPRAAVQDLLHTFSAEILRRQALDQDGVVPALVRLKIHGRPLSVSEVIGIVAFLLFAGMHTTNYLISNLMWILSESPELWSMLRDNRDQVTAAIDETLRFDCPAHSLTRIATRPTRIHGRQISAGEKLWVMIGAANRDPEKFGDPDAFRLDREPTPNLAFGHGIHGCLGAMLAKIEATAAINALLDRFHTISPGSRRTRVRALDVRGFEALTIHGKNRPLRPRS